MLTPEEIEVANLLGQAWNAFVKLPIVHHADRIDFEYAIRLAQNIVLARSGLRDLDICRPEPPETVTDDPTALRQNASHFHVEGH